MSLPAFVNEPTLELRRVSHRTALLEALAATDSRLPLAVPVLVGADCGSEEGIASHDPGMPDRCVATAGAASAADVDAAVARAAAQGPRWGRLPAAERAQILLRGATLLRGRRAALAALEVRECAKPWEDADADVCEAIDYLEYYARAAIALERGRPLLAAPGETNTLHYTPRGVTAVISPWNFPLAIPAGMTSAALATGNTVLLKPAEQSPACGLALVEALRTAGVPPDALSLLPGDGSTGAALVRHPAIDTVAFTGSSAVGREILRAAVETSTRQMKRVIAEMGGKNCVIVDADADLDEAVPALLRSAFGYAGQKCSACSRILVHEGVADELERRLRGAVQTLAVGQAEEFATDVPPLIKAAAQRRVRRYAAVAEAEGRILARGPRGSSRGWFCEPTIAADLPADSSLLREEIFGPLISFEVTRDVSAACATIEALPYALTAGLFSRDPDSIAQASTRLPAGNLYINRQITGALVGRQPFGGNRMSGLGSKAGGPDYLLQFVQAHTVTENTMRRGLALE